MTYTLDFSLALGGSKDGLTMAAQLVDTTGGDVGGEVTSGFTEIGEGFYLWHYAAIPDAHRGGVKFYEDGETGTILALSAVNPEEAELLDASIQTIDTVADAIKAVTDLLPDAGALDDLALILADTDELQADDIPGAISTHDGKLDTVDANVDAVLLSTDTNGVKVGADAIGAAQIAANAIGASELATDAIGSDQLAATAVTKLFAHVAEGALTFIQMWRVVYAVLAGKSTGGGTTSLGFRDVADGKNRVSATVDSSGNRTDMTNDGA